MLTVKLVRTDNVDGKPVPFETVVPASQATLEGPREHELVVKVYGVKNTFDVTHEFDRGTVYVMNDLGKTVQTWSVGPILPGYAVPGAGMPESGPTVLPKA